MYIFHVATKYFFDNILCWATLGLNLNLNLGALKYQAIEIICHNS